MILIKTLSIIIISDVAAKMDAQTFRTQNVDIVSGYRSTNTILSQHDGLSRVDCVSLCMQSGTCAGINFHPGDKSQCQLLGEGCDQEVAEGWEFAPKYPGLYNGTTGTLCSKISIL